MTVHRERCRIRGFAHGHQRRRFTSASRLLSLLHWLGGRRYQWQTAYVGGRIPPQILGHRDTCPVKGALIGKQISLALRPLLHQLDSADEEKPRRGSSKQLLPCRSPCDLPGPAPSALTRRCSSTCTGDTRKSARGRRIRPDRIRRRTTPPKLHVLSRWRNRHIFLLGAGAIGSQRHGAKYDRSRQPAPVSVHSVSPLRFAALPANAGKSACNQPN